MSMNSPYYDFSPLPARGPLGWPDGARLAVAIVLACGHATWQLPEGTVGPPSLRANGSPYPNVPDVHSTSLYDYGNRVGIFRITEILARFNIRPTVALDVATARQAPFLVDHLAGCGAEFVGHGLSAGQLITSELDEETERRIITESREALERATGQSLRGWMGSEHAESQRTVKLLAEAGFDYVLDWPNDEQPHEMRVPKGRITNLPVMNELDDVFGQVQRPIPVERFRRMITEQFDRLYQDAETTGRLFVMTVHPWVTGQPFRIRHFEEAIAHISRHSQLWFATTREIVDAYRRQAGN